MSDGRGKSDCCVVPQKLPNKAAGASPAAAEVVEGRRQAKGNALAARMSRRTIRTYDMGTALEGIRQTARGDKGARFTGLLHHIYAVERLRAAYLALKRDAAGGVDGQTWQSYGQALEARLLDLSDRLARGGYRPAPVKRVYIDKADGSKRPLGVPALEDKIVQRASAEVLGAIYEQDFCGFSYGFRPGKSAHNALDAVAVGVSRRRVNWILDADISKFFDTIIVRYADDWVAGFQFQDDAVRFWRAASERLGQFGLKLHPDKTRLIEFGRFARDNRSRRGQGKSQTFDFLGFTHCCGKTRKDKFMVLRLTSAKRLRAKLQAVKIELRRRMHRPIKEQGQYLHAVVAGHGRYFGVPDNGARLRVFRTQMGRLWHRTLCRRSQSHQLSWRRMQRVIAHWLPGLHVCHPYPNQRLIVTTQGKSRVR